MMRSKEQTLEVRSNDIGIEQKKVWAKQCINEGYSVEWAHEADRMRVYIVSEYHWNGWTDEVSADVMLSREPSPENLDGGRIKYLMISTNPNSSVGRPIFFYVGNQGIDELSCNSQARKLYEDVRRIFA